MEELLAAYPRVRDELWPAAWHHVERHENNRGEADHAQMKRRLRPCTEIALDFCRAEEIPARLSVKQNR